MDFGQALEALKVGKKVQRTGWNGKGMWLILVPSTKDCALRGDSPYYAALKQTSVTIGGHIDMYTATGEMQPGWLASQTDMLAEDWSVLL